MIVLFGLDAGFAMPTGVAARSADRFLSNDDLVVFLHDGVARDDLDRLRACVETADCLVVDCAARIDEAWVPPAHVTRAAFLRYLAADVLEDAERCLYLDGDTLVRRSPLELQTMELTTTLAAVRSRVAPFVSSPGGVQSWLELGLPSTASHFNSGVLLMNLDRWRNNDVTEQITDFMETYGSRASIADQEAVNAAVVGDWTELERTWNYVTHVTESFLQFPESEPSDPHVVHFAGRSKPWIHGRAPIYTDEWIRVLDETPWRGTRPSPPIAPTGPSATARRLTKRLLGSLRDYAR